MEEMLDFNNTAPALQLFPFPAFLFYKDFLFLNPFYPSAPSQEGDILSLPNK